jgi:hypothetical protein
VIALLISVLRYFQCCEKPKAKLPVGMVSRVQE